MVKHNKWWNMNQNKEQNEEGTKEGNEKQNKERNEKCNEDRNSPNWPSKELRPIFTNQHISVDQQMLLPKLELCNAAAQDPL